MIVDMMLKLCVVLGLIACTYAAVAIYPYQPKPAEFADQDGCYIDDLKRVLPYETPYYPRDGKSCVQYTCGTNNETQLVSCGSLGYPDNCRLEKDLSLDYPKCCGTVVCDPTTTTETPTTPSTETNCVTVTPPPCERPRTRKPTTTETPILVTPSTETTSATAAPPCERPKPRKPKYTLPVEKPPVY